VSGGGGCEVGAGVSFEAYTNEAMTFIKANGYRTMENACNTE